VEIPHSPRQSSTTWKYGYGTCRVPGAGLVHELPKPKYDHFEVRSIMNSIVININKQSSLNQRVIIVASKKIQMYPNRTSHKSFHNIPNRTPNTHKYSTEEQPQLLSFLSNTSNNQYSASNLNFPTFSNQHFTNRRTQLQSSPLTMFPNTCDNAISASNTSHYPGFT
jgi:hypothetical protein